MITVTLSRQRNLTYTTESMHEIKESAQLKKLLFRLTMLSAIVCFILTKLTEEFILGVEQVWFYQLIDYIMRGNL